MNMKLISMLVLVAVALIGVVVVWGLVDPENSLFNTGEFFTDVTCPDKNYARLTWNVHLPGFWNDPSITFVGGEWVDRQEFTGSGTPFGILWWHDFKGKIEIEYGDMSKTYTYDLGNHYTGLNANENLIIICDTMVNDQKILECQTVWSYQDEPIKWKLSVFDLDESDVIPKMIEEGYVYMES